MPDEHGFDVALRVEFGASIEGFFGGIAEELSGIESVMSAEF